MLKLPNQLQRARAQVRKSRRQKARSQHLLKRLARKLLSRPRMGRKIPKLELREQHLLSQVRLLLRQKLQQNDKKLATLVIQLNQSNKLLRRSKIKHSQLKILQRHKQTQLQLLFKRLKLWLPQKKSKSKKITVRKTKIWPTTKIQSK